MGLSPTRPLRVLGVDPGLSGAIAVVEWQRPLPATQPKLVGVWDMPTSRVETKGKSAKRRIDVFRLATLIDVHGRDVDFAVVEAVGPRPDEGVVSSFNFGYGYGLVVSAIGSNMIPMHFIQPGIWKMLMGLTRDKNLSRDRASKLFPEHRELFSRKKDDGRAESILLAVFGGERFAV